METVVPTTADPGSPFFDREKTEVTAVKIVEVVSVEVTATEIVPAGIMPMKVATVVAMPALLVMPAPLVVPSLMRIGQSGHRKTGRERQGASEARQSRHSFHDPDSIS
jgi:hypothetical protein